ncbi:hypothetical protein CR513_58881, partial [Mucuna pruriens]
MAKCITMNPTQLLQMLPVRLQTIGLGSHLQSNLLWEQRNQSDEDNTNPREDLAKQNETINGGYFVENSNRAWAFRYSFFQL